MERITTEQLDALEAVAKAAPPGPYIWNQNEIVAASNPKRGIAGIAPDEPDETGEFIVHACNLSPALVAEVQRYREDCGALVRFLDSSECDADFAPESGKRLDALLRKAREALEGGEG